jgi:hypothetical protein
MIVIRGVPPPPFDLADPPKWAAQICLRGSGTIPRGAFARGARLAKRGPAPPPALRIQRIGRQLGAGSRGVSAAKPSRAHDDLYRAARIGTTMEGATMPSLPKAVRTVSAI